MYIDASAIVAILLREPGYEDLVRRIEAVKDQLFTSPLARYEASVSFARARSGKHKKPSPELLKDSTEAVSQLLGELSVRDIHISTSIGDTAIRTAAEYGKAVGHPADLNFGDCFAYACAKAYRVGIIYKGDDFAKTDMA